MLFDKLKDVYAVVDVTVKKQCIVDKEFSVYEFLLIHFVKYTSLMKASNQS